MITYTNRSNARRAAINTIAKETGMDKEEVKNSGNFLFHIHVNNDGEWYWKHAKKQSTKVINKKIIIAENDMGLDVPSEGTICRQIWDFCTMYNADHGVPPTSDHITAFSHNATINIYTARTQYARWKEYHGIKGRIRHSQ